MSDTTFDYIIIGGGTAGCLLANRLSANASKRVLMIEAGRRDDYHWIHIPVGYLHCIGNPRTDWLYKTEAEPGLNGRSLGYPRGKTLGGSSSINGMIYMRGQARDYERWAELTGDDAWRWDSALASFRLHEDHYKLDASQSQKSSDCTGTFWTPFRWRRSKPASRRLTTSIPAITKVWAISRSTRKAAFAGTRPRLFCARPALAGPTLKCGPARKCAG